MRHGQQISIYKNMHLKKYCNQAVKKISDMKRAMSHQANFSCRNSTYEVDQPTSKKILQKGSYPQEKTKALNSFKAFNAFHHPLSPCLKGSSDLSPYKMTVKSLQNDGQVPTK